MMAVIYTGQVRPGLIWSGREGPYDRTLAARTRGCANLAAVTRDFDNAAQGAV